MASQGLRRQLHHHAGCRAQPLGQLGLGGDGNFPGFLPRPNVRDSLEDMAREQVGLELGSDPWADVSYEVSVDPVDDACIDISHLEQRWNLGVSGTAIDPDHISHPPGAFRVGDDHGHACFDVQENWI